MAAALLMFLGSLTLAAVGGAALARAEEDDMGVVLVKTQPPRSPVIDLRDD